MVKAPWADPFCTFRAKVVEQGVAVAKPGKGRGQDKFVAIDLDDNLTVVVAGWVRGRRAFGPPLDWVVAAAGRGQQGEGQDGEEDSAHDLMLRFAGLVSNSDV